VCIYIQHFTYIYFKASGSCADPFFFLVQVIQGTLWPSRTSNSQSRWSWEGPGVGLGPLGEALGVPGGPRGGAWGSYLLPRKCPPERLGGHLLSSASLEGPWGLPGGSLGVLGGSLGAPRCPSGHPGGSQGRSRRVENPPETVFSRSQEVKCVYFQRFKHVHFVDLMWPLGAPGPPLGGFGAPWRCQGRSWGGPGGRPGGNDSLLGRSRGVPRDRVPSPGGPRRALCRPNERFEAVVVFP